MTFEFLQTVAIWCTLSLSGGYTETIVKCREQALQCVAIGSQKEQAECITKVELKR